MKIVLFPYHPDIRTVINNRDALKDTEIVGVVSYKEDENLLDSIYEDLRIDRKSEIETIKNCDAVVLLENYRDYLTEKYYKVIDIAISAGKKVYISPILQYQLNLCGYDDKIMLLDNTHKYDECITHEYTLHRLLNKDSILESVDIPILAVMGLGKNCGKFETLLLAKQSLEEHYNVIAITPNPIGVLFGCHTLPSFMYEDRSVEWKVMRLNYYIKQLTENLKADVVVICIPEGVGAFKKFETNHFAEYPFVISTAMQIDMAIMCVYFSESGISPQGVEFLKNTIRGRFGVRIAGIAMSKTIFEVPMEDREIIYENLHNQYIESHYPELKGGGSVTAINLSKYDEAKLQIRKCVSQLEGNVSVI